VRRHPHLEELAGGGGQLFRWAKARGRPHRLRQLRLLRGLVPGLTGARGQEDGADEDDAT
jgi:hypothetical protein